MARKFLDGLAFGAGFAVSFLVLSYAVAILAMPMLTSGLFHERNDYPTFSSELGTERSGLPFHELPLEEQIETATVIALVRYQPPSDGKVKAIFSEILKKKPGTTFHYDIGDEYSQASYYPSDKIGRGDGQVVFFVGSPARMERSMTYTDDRITALGDMPLAQLREECRNADE